MDESGLSKVAKPRELRAFVFNVSGLIDVNTVMTATSSGIADYS